MNSSAPTPLADDFRAPGSWRSALFASLLALRPSPSALRAYFYSGWAFLIPYLAVYLLYYWQKWPANPVTSLPVDGRQLTGHGPPSTVHWLPIPPLLYVYWALHVIHVVLAAVALRSWWRAASQPLPTVDCPRSSGSLSTADRLPSTAYRTALRAVTPWLLLTLVFAIPGVYLEWPADPWEHLRRITEWNTHALVGSHSAGYKSFYFFAYSWVGRLSPTHLLSWLNVYYVGVCLLLAWQYYLLAKAVGLDRRWAFLFVIVNALTFGNSCFSFYRYYGISTSIFAQLGAVALTRIVLEYAKGEAPLRTACAQLSLDRLFFLAHLFRGRPAIADRSPVTTSQPNADRLRSTVHSAPTVCSLLFTALCLLALIAFNHIQGIGIAGFSIAAIVVWRLLKWKRSALWWLIASTFVVNALFLWLYPRPHLIEIYRAQGWLSAWYGFNILDLTSPAGVRMLQIIGVVGLIDLLAAAFTVRQQPIAELILFPFLALLLPAVAVPIALALGSGEPTNIIAFQRMLLSIPCGLAVTVVGHAVWCGQEAKSSYRFGAAPWLQVAGFTLVCALILIAGSSRLSGVRLYSRAWHVMSRTPADLELRYLRQLIPSRTSTECSSRDGPRVIATSLSLSFLEALTGTRTYSSFRALDINSSDRLCRFMTNSPAPEFLATSRTAVDTGASLAASIDGFISLRIPGKINNLKREEISPVRVLGKWTSQGGANPELVSTESITDGLGIDSIAQSPGGQVCYAFTEQLIPLSHANSYHLKIKIRQIRGKPAPVFLCVAWYDESSRLLESNLSIPHGAGEPQGWVNGTYSYFGLINKAASGTWSEHDIGFGWGQDAAIPSQAAFARFGAILNYNSTPAAIVQIAPVHLAETPPPDVVVIVPRATLLVTASSQAALLSKHWSPQAVPVGGSGENELLAQARLWQAEGSSHLRDNAH